MRKATKERVTEALRAKHRPLPELVAGHKREWTIRHSPDGGATNLDAHELTAPLIDVDCPKCETDHGRQIRIHELAHVQWSPPSKSIPATWKEYNHETILLAEDIRIHEALTNGNHRPDAWDGNLSPHHDTREQLAALTTALAIGTGTPDATDALLAQAFGDYPTPTTHYGHLHERINQSYKDTRRAIKDIRKTYPELRLPEGPDRAARQIATKLMRTAAELRNLLNDPDSHRRHTGARPRSLTAEIAYILNDAEESINGIGERQAEGATDDDHQESGDTKTYRPGAGEPTAAKHANWGELRINTPTLPIRHRPRRRQLRKIATTTGKTINPRRLVRAIAQDDGRAMTQRIRKIGGTVLVDISGSMGLTSQDVDALIDAAPGAVIATYSGNHNSGDLDVIANRGRRTERWNHHGGNIVDGPALSWLSEQPGPRLWVSDGQVTGKGDQQDPDLTREANRIIKLGHITRVESTTIAAAALTEGAIEANDNNHRGWGKEYRDYYIAG